MTPAPDRFRIDFSGKRLLERYVVESKLAEGGMGAVYLARDEGLDGERVVVKVPHGRFLAEEGFRERFDREIRELIKLSHPHVVAILARGEDDGIPFFVLKYLGGGSLRDRLRKQGAQSPAEVATWLPDVARTLDFIHGKDVIHRDVKPANVLFDAHGHVFLSDFGIAKALGSLDTGLTQTGMTPGSPDYMAPESMTESSLSPAYDQYALGVVVYEALCGALPHGPPGDTPFKVLLRKAQQDPAPLADRAPHVPAAVAAAVDRALRREPKARFPSCAAFADAFLSALRGPASDPEAATAMPTRVPPPPPPRRPRYVLRRAVVAVAALCMVGGVLWASGVFREKNVPGTLLSRDETAPALTVEPSGPEVDVGSEGRVTFRGRAVDANLASVRVDGVEVGPVGPDGAFEHEVSLAEGEVREIRFAARDAMGNTSVEAVRRVRRASRWQGPLRSALEAGRSGRWEAASLGYEEAAGLEVPSAEVPEWLRSGVGAWRAPASVTLVSPSDPHTTREERVKVRARLTTPRGTDTLWLGGEAVRTGPGEGEREVALAEGEHEVLVEAKDESGGVRSTLRLRVTREAVAPPKPSWAKTSSFQDEDAARLKIPVAREVDLGGGEALRFVWIPPGRFRMGSPATEEGHGDDEAQHEVELTQGFYLSIHEVTNGQYRRFKRDHDSGEYQGESLSGATQPAVMVSHEDATGYVGWLNGRGGAERYRLPTESEWEYACRAGTRTRYSFGDRDDDLVSHGNISDRRDPSGPARSDLDDGFGVTAPVGSYRANPWGLYDMHGNVWEWCSDWYGPYPSGVVRDPQGATSGGARVLRGGSWNSNPRYVRSADRGRFTPDNRLNNVGFRVVLLAPR